MNARAGIGTEAGRARPAPCVGSEDAAALEELGHALANLLWSCRGVVEEPPETGTELLGSCRATDEPEPRPEEQQIGAIVAVAPAEEVNRDGSNQILDDAARAATRATVDEIHPDRDSRKETTS